MSSYDVAVGEDIVLLQQVLTSASQSIPGHKAILLMRPTGAPALHFPPLNMGISKREEVSRYLVCAEEYSGVHGHQDGF